MTGNDKAGDRQSSNNSSNGDTHDFMARARDDGAVGCDEEEGKGKESGLRREKESKRERCKKRKGEKSSGGNNVRDEGTMGCNFFFIFSLGRSVGRRWHRGTYEGAKWETAMQYIQVRMDVCSVHGNHGPYKRDHRPITSPQSLLQNENVSKNKCRVT